MKKTQKFALKMLAVLCMALLFAFALSACADNGAETPADENTPGEAGEELAAAAGIVDNVTVDYGESSIYTQEDMDAAVNLIKDEFAAWDGCELHSIRYAGDECNSADNIKWMNELKDGAAFSQCIEFLSDFHSPVEGGGAWEADSEYTNWQWWLAREDGGDWQLLTWGY